MTNKKDAKLDPLAALQAAYADQLPEKLAFISVVLERIEETMSFEEVRAAVEDVRFHAHKLSGSGATFGFPELSVSARDLEQYCDKILAGSITDTAELRKGLSELFNKLEHHDGKDGASVTNESLFGKSADETGEPSVIVIDPDVEMAERLAKDLQHYNYVVHCITHPSELAGAISEFGCNMIISEMHFGGDDMSSVSTISQVQNDCGLTCPIIYCSSNNDIASRLAAVRAKGSAFLTKPLDAAALVDTLDQLNESDDSEPFRILIVDDDTSLANFHGTILKGAGMHVEMLNDPTKIMEVVEDFSPELMLMDLYMPECTGLELAAVIRQQSEFNSIPIVFLSAEVDVDKQLSAMRLGGDDFLTKPIRPEHLISSVRARVGRFRMLRGMMVRDSMTGLYNHTTTKQLLENEVSRAKREKLPLALVSLDIDHFKSVNDTYGHGVGDTVIKSLARLLKQRLRSTDIIGRMGGEEFSAILPGTPIAEAEKVLNGIRVAFADIDFDAGDGSGKHFNVTLSCGIADFPRYGEIADLSDESDRALYTAKNGGRNKVVLA